MQNLWLERKPTVILVTHDLKEAAYLANRICIMQARPGRIIEDRQVPFARPRTIEMTYAPDFVALTQHLRDASSPPRHQGGGVMTQDTKRRIASAALIVGFFVLWEVFLRRRQDIERGAAAPQRGGGDAVRAARRHLAARLADLVHDADRLCPRVGFGVLIGILIGASKLAYAVVYPLAGRLLEHPKVAVVPIFVLWFGAGTVPAILTAMILCVFPVVVNVGNRARHHRARA